MERVDRQTVLELLAKNPIIASVKDEEGLSAALDSDVPVIFLLFGDIVTVRTRLSELKTVYCIFSQTVEKDGTVLAEISTKIAFVNPETMRPVPCPPSVAEALRRFQAECQG